MHDLCACVWLCSAHALQADSRRLHNKNIISQEATNIGIINWVCEGCFLEDEQSILPLKENKSVVNNKIWLPGGKNMWKPDAAR